LITISVDESLYTLLLIHASKTDCMRRGSAADCVGVAGVRNVSERYLRVRKWNGITHGASNRGLERSQRRSVGSSLARVVTAHQ
jgi:hypothetical protein